MLNKHIRILFIFLALLTATGINAQQYSITGRVCTFDSIPLIRAQVIVNSTKSIVETDYNGIFMIDVSEGDKINFIAEGFSKKVVKVKGNPGNLWIDMKLKSGEQNAEMAMRDGGHIRVSDRAKFKALSQQGIDYSMYSNIYDALRTISGVQIVGNEIQIRGLTSITPGNNSALLVVDGVIVSQLSFAATPTSDIKRIRVLKGSEAAIYGSQGGNGVVEVETKRGND